MLLDRDDGVINIVEIKYSQKPFRITKQYATQLGDKIDIFREQLNIKKDIYLTMITVAGLLPNAYVDELVTNELTLERSDSLGSLLIPVEHSSTGTKGWYSFGF